MTHLFSKTTEVNLSGRNFKLAMVCKSQRKLGPELTCFFFDIQVQLKIPIRNPLI
jgi:hypothetical protein